MKLNKIYAIALAALTLTACSDDDGPSLNTESGVTVGFNTTYTYEDRVPATSDTLFVNENAGIFNVPIVVSGATNGSIIVEIETITGTADPANHLDAAKEVDNYVVTTKKIRIPEGATSAAVEVNAIWPQGVIDNDRTFTLKIKNAQGATVSNAETIVTIKNIDSAYTMMLGSWTFTGNDWDGLPVTYDLTMSTPDASDPDYGSFLMATGFLGYNFGFIPFEFAYDQDTDQITMSIPAGAQASTGAINFGSFTGIWATASSQSLWGADIPVDVVDYNEITVDPNKTLFIVSIDVSTMAPRSFWDKFNNMNLKRK